MKRLLAVCIMLLAAVGFTYAQEDVDMSEMAKTLEAKTDTFMVQAAKSDVEMTIPMGLDLYFIDNGAYPSTSQGLAALVFKPDTAQNWNGPYLSSEKKLNDPWGNQYVYEFVNAETPGFMIYSLGPDGKAGTKDDIVFKSSDLMPEEQSDTSF